MTAVPALPEHGEVTLDALTPRGRDLLRYNLAALAATDVVIPTELWWAEVHEQVQTEWEETRYHRAGDCTEARHGMMLKAVTRGADNRPVTICRHCRSWEQTAREELRAHHANRAMVVTAALFEELRKRSRPDSYLPLTRLVMLNGGSATAWSRVDDVSRTSPAHQKVHARLQQVWQALIELLAERKREVLAEATAESDANDLLLYCAGSLSAWSHGCLEESGVTAPVFNGFDPRYLDDFDAWLGEIADGAYDDFCRHLGRDGDVEAAARIAVEDLTGSDAFERDWARGCVAQWVTRLGKAENTQAAAGMVRVRLPHPSKLHDPWAGADDAFVRWLEEFHPDGTVVLHLPAALADQVICTYLDFAGAPSWQTGVDPSTYAVQFLPSPDVPARVLPVVEQFWRPGGTEKLPVVIVNARLVSS